MQLSYLLCRQSALFASAAHNAGFILSSRLVQRTIVTCSHRNMNIKLLATDTENLVNGTSFSIRVLLCHRTVFRRGIEFTPMTNTTLAQRACYVIRVTAANIQHYWIAMILEESTCK